MHDSVKKIIERYKIDIKNLVSYKDGYILITPQGRKYLKKVKFSTDRVLFIHSVKEHLIKNGFGRVDRFICSNDGLPYVSDDNDLYTLNEMVDGRELNFDLRSDVCCASKLLADFHKASKGYATANIVGARDEFGKLPGYFKKRLEEIKKLKKAANKGRSKFDYMFRDYADCFYGMGVKAISMIGDGKYDSVVERSRREGSICHHDFTHHNIVHNEKNTYLINFDYCCMEIKVYDIANLLRRKMRKCNWDIREAEFIIKEYRGVENLNDDEIYVMKAILQFPQKFWRVANKFYNSRRSWSEKSCTTKLSEVIEEIAYHKSFMDKYDSIF